MFPCAAKLKELTASLADYLLPTAADFPAIRGEFVQLALAPGNPLGVKGAGEGGIVAVAAAVSNAVSAKKLGAWNFIEAISPKIEPMTSHTAALIKIVTSGRRQEAAICSAVRAGTSFGAPSV